MGDEPLGGTCLIVRAIFTCGMRGGGRARFDQRTATGLPERMSIISSVQPLLHFER